MNRRKLLGGLAATTLIGGCAHDRRADPALIAARRYISDEPAFVAIMTMVNRNRESGAHTGLLINGSEQVIYDPAGTFSHPDMPERGDIHYGASERYVDYYKRYHARFSHYVHTQTVPVSRATADAVLRRTQEQGPAGKMFCTVYVSQILQSIAPFTHVRRSFFPESLRQDFRKIAGVIDTYVVEEDKSKALPDA